MPVTVKRYPCPLDPTVQVLELPFGEDAQTHAMIVMCGGEGVILLNENLREEPWFTPDHLNAVFAHELGHLMMGEFEEDAERWAIDKLGELGFVTAQKLLIDRGIV